MSGSPTGRAPHRAWGEDDTGCHILHVDMDAFFAAVELARRPELRGRPLVVGGADRSVVLAASYEARAYGVRSAMPMTQALRACPRAVVVPPDQERYRAVSREVMEALRDITPVVEQVSVDEAYLDVSGARRRSGSPVQVGRVVRSVVRERVGLPCSVGVAATKTVAKLASTRAKPDGLMLVPRAATVPFLHSLPVGALWGVGARTRESLERWGVTTVAELAATDPAVLRRAVGRAAALHLHGLAHGRDERPVRPDRVEKSVGAETTFAQDCHDLEVVRRRLLGLADRTASALRARGLQARTVTLKVRTADFSTVTRSRTLERPTDATHVLHGVSRDLLGTVDLGERGVRLVGVRAEQLLASADRPPTLEEAIDGVPSVARRADAALDEVRSRFGAGALGHASLLRRPGES